MVDSIRIFCNRHSDSFHRWTVFSERHGQALITQMYLFKETLSTPEENLALDEALVEVRDAVLGINDQDAVGRGVEGRVQQRQRAP